MSQDKLHVLHLPGWYPTREDPAYGIFIQKHIETINEINDCSVIFVHNLGSFERLNLHPFEYHAYYKASKNILLKHFSHYRKYNRLLHKCYHRLVKEKGKPHLIHLHILNNYNILAFHFIKQLNIPFVLSEQWSGYVNGNFEKKSGLHKGAVRQMVKHSSGVSAVSGYLKNGMIKLGLQHSNFQIIPNVLKFHSVENQTVKDDGIIHIMNISDLVDKVKNISGLMRAFARLKDHQPNVRLHIVGRGRDEKLLKDLGKQLGLDNQIHWYGYLPHQEVIESLKRMSFYVCSSPFETFNVAVAEALSMGLPVLSTRCGGPEEFIHNGNGLLVPANDPEALLQGLKDMTAQHTRFDSKKISDEVILKFNPTSITKQFDAFYRMALAKKLNYD